MKMTQSDERRGGRRVKPALLGTGALLGLGVALQLLLGHGTATAAAEGREDLIRRGQYLVALGGCNDCHTPFKMGPNGPEPDMSKMLSGHPEALKMPPAPKLGNGPWMWAGASTNTAFAGPWGVSYAPNLTPDSNTGIGQWPTEYIVKAMRTGRHVGVGRPILPPMPWQGIGKLTDEDLQAIAAYLKSIPPIKNKVPESVVATPPAPRPAASKGK